MTEKVVIDLSPSPVKDKQEGEAEPDDGSPLRPIFCLKKQTDLKRIEEAEDCFILDFEPSDSIDIAKLSVAQGGDDVDLSVIAEKGQVSIFLYFLWYILFIKSSFLQTWFCLVDEEIYTFKSKKGFFFYHYDNEYIWG